MKYSIVIPTYNHCDDLLRPCVEAILKYTKMTDVELIISANGCTDNTREYLAELKNRFILLGFNDHLQTVWHNEPLGYSRATNAGIRVATGKYVILLNNDAFLMPQERNHWIEKLTQPFLDNPRCGISCLVKGPSEPAGHAFAIFFCVMIDHILFDRIGLLNEEYGKGGGEDTEFSIEAERAGFEVIECVPREWGHEANTNVGDFPIWHKGEGTVHDVTLVPDWNEVFLRNSLKLAKKYNPNWYYSRAQNIPVNHKSLKEQDAFIYNEIFEANAYGVLKEEIENRTVIDIGANIGMFSILCHSLGAKAIYAIEAQPTIYRRKLIDNTICYPTITTLNYAVYDDFGHKVRIADQSGNSKIGNEGEEVDTITLEKLLVDHRINADNMVLKIDCEGSEFNVILSSRLEVLRRFSVVYMEVHKDMNPNPNYHDPELVRSKLSVAGFSRVSSLQLMGYPHDAPPIPMGCFVEKWIKTIQ